LEQNLPIQSPMNAKHLLVEWQTLSEGVQAIINDHLAAWNGEKDEHRVAAARVEGFLITLSGLASAWATLAADLPVTEFTAHESRDTVPQSHYYRPLAVALESLGGRAKTQDAIAKVGELMAAKLQDADRDLVETGSVRWMVNTRFARQELRERGLLNATQPGIWELSEAGLRWARSNVEAIPAHVPVDIPGQLSLF
jgi:hypothetical protein